ncbi:hypothetical protein KSP40_PGU007500 [Platanthera guangdongensis]|uniref:Uncharacterized protein n=1 Tax=Platanthera guangdongensis TaxID=2320717 RepID=A0ABR2N159_9ASPA
MSSARNKAVAAFLTAEHKRSKITQSELDDFFTRHMGDSEIIARLLEDDERINTAHHNLVTIPIDHFSFGFAFPPLIELIKILDFYGVVLDQLSLNTVTSIMSFIIYLRKEQVTFTMNLFRNFFVTQSITTDKGVNKVFRGVLYFGSTGMKVVNLPNKVSRWSERYLMFEGNLQLLPFKPQVRPSNTFQPNSLGEVEEDIVKFLANERLDVKHYISPLQPVTDLPVEERRRMERTCPGGRTLRAQKIIKSCPVCPYDISDFLQNPQEKHVNGKNSQTDAYEERTGVQSLIEDSRLDNDSIEKLEGKRPRSVSPKRAVNGNKTKGRFGSNSHPRKTSKNKDGSGRLRAGLGDPCCSANWHVVCGGSIPPNEAPFGTVIESVSTTVMNCRSSTPDLI